MDFSLIKSSTVFRYLHEYVVAADQMAIEMMFCVVMMSEYVMSVLERVDDTILESKIDRMRLQQENLQMKRNAENHIISIINVQPVGSKRLIYTKTRQLARIMIREAFTYLEEKMKSGEVDDHEYETVRELLQQKIEMTREFFTFDKQPPPLFDESRLDLIPWIRLSEKRRALIRFIMSHLEDRIFPRKNFLMIQGQQSDGVFYLVNGICRFAVRQGDSLKPLHLLYAGRFVGESAFFTSSGPGIPASPIRSGSVYAETHVICKFLPIRHVAHMFNIDPTVKEKFEENTAVYRCHDLMRLIREYTVWTTPALDSFIRNNWVVCQHEMLIDRLDAAFQMILIKGNFILDGVREDVTTKLRILNGPAKNIVVDGSMENRCFFILIAKTTTY
uniref:Cyclic nucleotide-binding domain-containing protein n=1 Tax=Romanomermis culicivorax TaxID=13658 RepID=A0A915K7H2_ROMCU